MSAASAVYLFIKNLETGKLNRPLKDARAKGIAAFCLENQTLFTPESLKFVACDLSPSALLRGTDFLLDLPTVPGTAKPVKSRLQ
jgi:hypothetical protein